MARAGGYYRAAFKGYQGVNQLDPLSTTISNVVLDEVVSHWLTMMVEVAEERGENGQKGRHQNSVFYTDYGMVALSDPQWLQGAFSTLICLFNRVGLQTNFRKTFGMFY